MYRLLILVPAIGLILGPRLWVEYTRSRHDREEIEGAKTGAEVARELLDAHGLPDVKVEQTDIGDHYDPEAKSVRLSRGSYRHRTLAALVTAAHEVGHALQDATGYAPFRWRSNLVRVARGTAEVGGVLLISTPITALLTRTPVPPTLVGGTACAVLGSGLAAQLATLPTEWDASFNRAMPMLEQRYLVGTQIGSAKELLMACSLTYVAASFASVLQIWPWIPRSALLLTSSQRDDSKASSVATLPRKPVKHGSVQPAPRARETSGLREAVHYFGKPLFRAWYRARARTVGLPQVSSTFQRQVQPGR
jgi:Zn-dependent membrane protease YugP